MNKNPQNWPCKTSEFQTNFSSESELLENLEAYPHRKKNKMCFVTSIHLYNNTVKSITTYLDGYKHGLHCEWDEQGNLINTTIFNHGQPLKG